MPRPTTAQPDFRLPFHGRANAHSSIRDPGEGPTPFASSGGGAHAGRDPGRPPLLPGRRDGRPVRRDRSLGTPTGRARLRPRGGAAAAHVPRRIERGRCRRPPGRCGRDRLLRAPGGGTRGRGRPRGRPLTLRRPTGPTRAGRQGRRRAGRSSADLVSSASVRELGRRGDRPDLDARRFRINLEIDGCDPYEEDAWDGELVRIGHATIRVHGQIPRCVVTTLAPDTGKKDFLTLNLIARSRRRIRGRGGLPFGMYAEIVDPGRVRVGDPVEPLSPRPAETASVDGR